MKQATTSLTEKQELVSILIFVNGNKKLWIKLKISLYMPSIQTFADNNAKNQIFPSVHKESRQHIYITQHINILPWKEHKLQLFSGYVFSCQEFCLVIFNVHNFVYYRLFCSF